jgi:glutamate synthase domain-containing protein 1
VHQQIFVGKGSCTYSEDEFECRLYLLRKTISGRVYTMRERRGSGYYPVSLSCRTVIYKGMFLADQLGTYYPDLHDTEFVSALALVHQRFSTNTFPTWSLSHPYRMIAHNGEINTLRGNRNWMAARQASARSPYYGEDINKLWPISYEGQSDTACFDNALEFLVQGGYPLAHAVMIMIPEAWSGNPLMDEERRAFYEYNAALMEPWDGPAAIAFTDGRQIGATLDRNGLRPARYLEPVIEEEDFNARYYHQAGDLDGHGLVEVVSDMMRYDAARLRHLISRHARLAGSRRAAHILANWDAYLPRFRKVMPLEYRRALREMKALQAAEPLLAVAGG